jgi:glucose-1-phosphate adenylyltransferase
LTQFNSASLNKHIKNTYHFSSFSDAFVDILAAEQTPSSVSWFQGTADAVRQSLHHLAVHDFDYVLILSGDQLYQMDFDDMIKNHITNNAEISIATIPVHANDVPGFGILQTDENSLITQFVEKPKKDFEYLKSDVSDEMVKQGRYYLASMGIYMFNRKTLFELLEGNDRTDFGKEIIPQSIPSHTVLSYQYEGYWTDIGTIPSFFEANLGLTDDIPQFNLFDKNYIFTRARMLPPSKVSGSMEKTIIADGCIINASRIYRSVIGIRTRIGHDTIIENCYVMGSDNYQTLEQIQESRASDSPIMGIGDRCVIKNAIIDKNTYIGNDVNINCGGKKLEDGDYGTHTVQDGIVVIKKRAIIPNGTTI